MIRALFAAVLFGTVLATLSQAGAADAVLYLDAGQAPEQPDRALLSEEEKRSFTRIDLSVSSLASADLALSIGQNGLHVPQVRQSGERFPVYWLVAPASGVLLQDVGSRFLQIDAVVAVDFGSRDGALTYDITLLAEVPGSRGDRAQLEIFVQGRARENTGGRSRHEFSGVMYGWLEE